MGGGAEGKRGAAAPPRLSTFLRTFTLATTNDARDAVDVDAEFVARAAILARAGDGGAGGHGAGRYHATASLAARVLGGSDASPPSPSSPSSPSPSSSRDPRRTRATRSTRSSPSS
jgi:hypothetical protein